MQKHHFSAAEVTGIIAIGLVVFSAWLYSILLEYQFFLSITPSNNPIFPYLGLAFTGVGFALWGIGFLCARKPFTQVTCMLMGLASGGTAFTIAYMEFTTAGDAHYNIAADPTVYKNALLVVGVMFLLNLISLALKAIVWRFSQLGTGFFEHHDPNAQYLPAQQSARYVDVRLQGQPKEERVFEQRSIKALPPTSEPGTGFMSRLRNGIDAFKQPVYASTPVQQPIARVEQVDELPVASDEEDTKKP